MNSDLGFSSALLATAVEQFSRLPGIGSKTAMRLVLHLLHQPEEHVDALAESLTKLRHEVHYCRKCHNIADADLCPICASPRRDATTVCVVENIQDVMAIEQTRQYHGLYHVLGGIISPIDGIAPSDLTIDALIARTQTEDIHEIIFALSPTMEGDTTTYYIARHLPQTDLTLTIIARGVAQNDELQYADEVTLGRAIVGRTPYAR